MGLICRLDNLQTFRRATFYAINLSFNSLECNTATCVISSKNFCFFCSCGYQVGIYGGVARRNERRGDVKCTLNVECWLFELTFTLVLLKYRFLHSTLCCQSTFGTINNLLGKQIMLIHYYLVLLFICNSIYYLHFRQASFSKVIRLEFSYFTPLLHSYPVNTSC